MKVRDYMSTEVELARMSDGLKSTFHRMRGLGIRHMPVLDEYEALAGIISDRDLRRPDTLEDTPWKSAWYHLDDDTKVYEAMSVPAISVSPETPLRDALEPLIEERYGALPVVDDAGRVVGILSVVDALCALRGLLDEA